MKILMISNDERLLDAASASAQRMREYGTLVEHLSIIVLGAGGAPTTLSDAVTVYPTVRFKPLAVLWSVGVAIAVQRAQGMWDVITTHDPFFAGKAGWLIRLFLGGRLQLQAHVDVMSPWFRKQSLGNRIRYWLARFFLPRADCLRVVSPRIKTSLSSVISHRVPITVLPIFIDVDAVRDAPITTDLRVQYPDADFIILMASRLTQEKNIPLALRAFKNIVNNHSNAMLVIAGDGAESSALKAQAEQLGIADNVRFVGWVDDLGSYYRTADYYLLTSNYEGYGRTLVEAAAAGCSIVTTDVGIAPDLQGATVVLVDDEEALTQALLDEIEGARSTTKLPGWIPTDKQEYLKRYRESWGQCSNEAMKQ